VISKEEAKANLLAEALAVPARDAIVLVTVRQYGHGPSGGSSRPLVIGDVAPDASEADSESANRLLANAAEYGGQWWNADPGDGRAAVERAMREDNPGFLEATYRTALDFGCLRAR